MQNIHPFNFKIDFDIFDNISDGIQVLDNELRYLYLNNACIKQAREPKERLLGNKITEVYKGIENTELYSKLNECIKEKKSYNFENEFVYPDGKRGWFLLRIEPVDKGIIIFSTDITELKQKEERILILNNLLKSIRDINQLIVRERDRKRLIDSACKILTSSKIFKIAIIILGQNDNINSYSVSGNDKIIFNISELIEHKSLPDCIRITQNANIIQIIKDTKDCDKCPLFESICKENEVIILPIMYGIKGFGTLMCVTDGKEKINDEHISLLKEICGDLGFSMNNADTEIQLGKSVKLFENFMDYVENIMVVLNNENQIQYINPHINKYGFNDELLTGRPFIEIIPENEKGIVIKELFEIRSGKIREFEIHLTDHSKKLHTFRARGRMLPDEKGELVTILIMENITEYKLLERQMIASQKLESIGRLAGGVAHDFNNILSVILNHTDFAINEIKQENKIYDNLVNIKNATLKAADLTRMLLSFSRQQTLHKKIININKAITDLIKFMDKIIEENIKIDFVPSRNTINVCIDPTHFDQILMNLLVNARDAMPYGGKIIISSDIMSISQEYRQNYFYLKAGNYATIAVSDTGIGMDESIISKIFEPFFTTKEAGKGTGLGLSTVYTIVKQYGGDIFVYSEVEKGSTFKVYLPITEEMEIIEQKEIEKGDLNGKNETILVVEDDDSVRGIIIKILKEANYNVISTSNPEEAIRQVAMNKGIDILLCDVILPQTNGLELSKILIEKIPKMKIILMSGYSKEILTHHKLNEGSFNLIQKPFDSMTLKKRIREVLGK